MLRRLWLGTSQPAEAESEYESELVVAIFRTLLILLGLAVMAWGGASVPPSQIQLSLGIAGAYNLALVVLYWRKLRLGRARAVVIFLDLCLISSWVYLAALPLAARLEAPGPMETLGLADMRVFSLLFPLYELVVIVAGMWYGVAGTVLTAGTASAMYLWCLNTAHPQLVAAQLQTAFEQQVPLLFVIALLVGYLADVQRRERERTADLRALGATYRERARTTQIFYELLIPQKLPAIAGLDLGLGFRPMLRMGAGDFYHVFSLPDGRWAVCIADVAGKQTTSMVRVPALKYALLSAAKVFREPGETMQQVNEMVYPELQPDMFITACYAVLDLERGELRYANAGHEPPLVVRDGPPRCEWLPIAGTPLGVFLEEQYQQATVPIHPGDVLVLYTDGITGARDRSGQEFGQEQLCETLRQGCAAGMNAQALADYIAQAVHERAQGGERHDDMTLLVVRVLKLGESTGSAAEV